MRRTRGQVDFGGGRSRLQGERFLHHRLRQGRQGPPEGRDHLGIRIQGQGQGQGQGLRLQDRWWFLDFLFVFLVVIVLVFVIVIVIVVQ